MAGFILPLNKKILERSTAVFMLRKLLTLLVINYLIDTDVIAVTESQKNVCVTKGCTEAAKVILSNMDKSINPCEDFYHFACGNYLKNTAIPKDQSSMSYYKLGDELINKQLKSALEGAIKPTEPKTFKLLQNYYKLCMNTALLEQNSENDLKEVLKGLGGWPLLEGPSWKAENFEWKKLINTLFKTGYSYFYFLSVTLARDRDDPTKNIVVVKSPAFNIDQVYLRNTTNSKVLQAYVEYMNKYAVLLGANPDRAKKELSDSFNFERELAKIALTPEEENDEKNAFGKMSIQELENKYKGFPWLEYINNLTKPKTPLTAQYRVAVSGRSYLQKFVAFLAKTPKRVLANYIMWGVAVDSAELLSLRVQRLKNQLDSAIYGVSSLEERWKFCLNQLQDNMNIGIGSMFIRRFYSTRSKAEAIAMLTNIHNTFRRMIQQLDWMDSSTKAYAVEKLNVMRKYISYPNELLDNRKVDDIYKNLTVDPKSYLKTQLDINRKNTLAFFSGLENPTDPSNWINHADVAVANAWESDWENSVFFPAGILQGVFFSPDRTKYLNYASMGTTMGHETTHAFDDRGSNYDKDGKVKNWWGPQTRQQFKKKIKCMEDQYSNYTVKEVNMKINGTLTARENVADNGGYREAYLAYDEWEKENGPEPTLKGLSYTPRQLFWIYSATTECVKSTPERTRNLILTDDHSPDEYRTNGPLSNMIQFSHDFNCSVTSLMNSPRKCIVW